MGTLIVTSVIVLVLVLFVGLVWLFVRISGPPVPRLPEPEPGKNTQAAKPQRGGTQKGKPHR